MQRRQTAPISETARNDLRETIAQPGELREDFQDLAWPEARVDAVLSQCADPADCARLLTDPQPPLAVKRRRTREEIQRCRARVALVRKAGMMAIAFVFVLLQTPPSFPFECCQAIAKTISSLTRNGDRSDAYQLATFL